MIAHAPELTSTSCNIASHLPAMARRHPELRAVVAPAGRDAAGRMAWSHLTFAQLDARSDAIARGLVSHGIVRGTRTVLMVRPSLDFFALTFALFKVGAVLVLIDPGIGRRRLLRCLEEVEAEAFVGVPEAHVARLLFPRPFRTVKSLVTVGKKLFWGGRTLEALVDPGPFEMADTAPDEVAAILFTSGSTGIPKGAVYTHGIFDAQVRLLRKTYGFSPGEIDLPTFPPFALFDPALGMTAILPEMDARFPAKADPAKLVEAIEDHGVTNLFGSPALLDNLSRHCEAKGLKLPTLRRVLSAGAPVRPDILERMQAALVGDAEVHTPFGATESLPVCSIGSREVLGETAARTAEGAGICVGRPVEEMQVRIIRIDDGPIEKFSDDLLVAPGEIGEITVRGPVVTESYWARPEQTALVKIRDGDAIVHRMGDLGWQDEQGRIWMCGRKSHRVGELYPVQIEEILNRIPGVHRTALVDSGQGPAIAIEAAAGASADLVDRVRMEAWERELPVEIFLLHPGPLPVDTRHNAKIEREKIAVWAKAEVARGRR